MIRVNVGWWNRINNPHLYGESGIWGVSKVLSSHCVCLLEKPSSHHRINRSGHTHTQSAQTKKTQHENASTKNIIMIYFYAGFFSSAGTDFRI